MRYNPRVLAAQTVMKTLIMLLSALAIAGFTNRFQEQRARNRSEYQVVEHQGRRYEVFSYGFPLRVHDGDAALASALASALSPSLRHTRVRLAGNFLFFTLVSFAGFQLLWLAYSRVRSKHQMRMYLKLS